ESPGPGADAVALSRAAALWRARITGAVTPTLRPLNASRPDGSAASRSCNSSHLPLLRSTQLHQATGIRSRELGKVAMSTAVSQRQFINKRSDP
ncbi:MAG TPA: hypothetical protein VJ608_09265, partial [Albitalea sp.]|nr:hypothetical protein [Albitalea sp.]